jgi:Nucleotidyltransferase of unknown function (DUF6036)
MSSDFSDLLNLFKRCRVRYLIVGGHAVMKYTEPRFTKDLDIWIEASPKNARAVFKALREFGAPLADLGAEDFAKEGFFYQMGRPPSRIDILMSIAGVKFADAWPNRVKTEFEGAPAYIISREDLTENKRTLARPQDLADLENLIESERLAKGPARKTGQRRKKPSGG